MAAWDLMLEEERQLGGEPPELGCGGAHVFTSDQAAWSELYFNGEADIAVDAQGELVLALAPINSDIALANHPH